MLGDDLEERLEVRPLHGRVQGGVPGPRIAVDDRELDLRLVRVEIQEELVDLVDYLLRARVRRSILLTTSTTGRRRSRVFRNTKRVWAAAPRLRHEEEHPVHHRQCPLDLPAEVSVAGRVDDVELHPSVADGGVLGEDRDPLLPLEVIESITRSLTSWLARKTPDCHSIPSTSVVLPWSTWATMARLRKLARESMRDWNSRERTWHRPGPSVYRLSGRRPLLPRRACGDPLRFAAAHRLGERHPDDLTRLQGDHLAEGTVVDGVDGGHAEPGRQNPVECGRRPAPLDVAEDRDPRLEAGAMLDLAREEIGDASEPLMTVRCRPRVRAPRSSRASAGLLRPRRRWRRTGPPHAGGRGRRRWRRCRTAPPG